MDYVASPLSSLVIIELEGKLNKNQVHSSFYRMQQLKIRKGK